MLFLTWLMIVIISTSTITSHVEASGGQEEREGELEVDADRRNTTDTEYTDKTDYQSQDKCGDVVYNISNRLHFLLKILG